MKRIGILTYYYGNYNFGGLLQAYALTKVINRVGQCEAEQICYRVSRGKQDESNSRYKITALKLVKGICRLPYRMIERYQINSALVKLKNRKAMVEQWAEKNIPHSSTIYDRSTIERTNSDYSIFCVGSDQVWNEHYNDFSYYLDFVERTKEKFSYGASICQSVLGESQARVMSNVLPGYNAVSVRERESAILLEPIVSANVVLDPTLLLEEEEWDELCAKRIIDEKYVFCYFLGNNKEDRILSTKFAKVKGLKIVTLPHLSLDYHSQDKHFGDIKLYDADPSIFLSLIKYSEYICTDSFHATVFSNIYRKRFFVFERHGYSAMTARLRDLLDLFDAEQFLCENNDKKSLKYMLSVDKENFGMNNLRFLKLKDYSYSYFELVLS